MATYTIAEKPVPGSKAGIILRVGGKSIGRPHLFRLEHDETLSDRSRRRVVDEINLPPDSLELTAAAGDVIESDKSFEHLSNAIRQTSFAAYRAITASAHRQLDWLIEQLKWPLA